MAKTQPTAEQWRDIEERLGKMWDTVYMECDGFLVAFTLKRVEKMRLAIAVYVNGWFKGEWLGLGRDKPPSEEGRRFYQERTCSVHRGKTKVMVRRAFGKKESEKKFSYRSSVWASAKSLRRHLVAHNESIRLLTHEEYEAAIEAQPKDETEATA